MITDTTLPTPQNSYGIQKFIGEQLVADYARKGFIRGRNVRLMTVSVRPGKPNGAASSFLSGMIREPLAGVRAVCPVAPETPVALSSPGHTIAGLIRAAEASDADWGARTAINLPALKTTAGEMAAALERVAGKDVAALIDWQAGPGDRQHRDQLAGPHPGRPGRRPRPAAGPKFRRHHSRLPQRKPLRSAPARGVKITSCMTTFPDHPFLSEETSMTFFKPALSRLALGMTLALGLVAGAAAQTTMKISISTAQNSHQGVAIDTFAREVEKRTGGRYKIQTFYNGSLGGERESIEAVQLGTQELAFSSTGPVPNFVPETKILDVPFLFRDKAHARAVLDGPIGQDLLTKFDSQGLQGAGLGRKRLPPHDQQQA